ncbi:MAG: hypothetical protein NC410_08370 [Oscillibacter sp.]|nr:hypothetical protein [Oscillibacter sp.]
MFCVFWIPTIYHQELPILKGTKEIKDIDISDNIGHSCKLTLNLSNDHNIEVKLDIKDCEKIEFTLKRTAAHENGLFSYNFDVEDKNLEFVKQVIKYPVYHFTKGFYHNHQFHSDDCDSILTAFISDKKVDIGSPDNEVLIHYLEQYEERFKTFVEQLKYDIAYLEKIANEDDYKSILHSKYDIFYQTCNNILGEVIYYRTLFNSKYNHSFRLNGHNSTNENNLYKKAQNAENAISRIQLIAEKVRNISISKKANFALISLETIISLQKDVQKSLEQGKKASKLSVRLGWLSVILALLSLVVCVIC